MPPLDLGTSHQRYLSLSSLLSDLTPACITPLNLYHLLCTIHNKKNQSKLYLRTGVESDWSFN